MDSTWEKAVKLGDCDVVRVMLDSGADVNALDRYGQSGLMLAAHAGHRAVVELLVANGADLDVTAKFGLSAVMLAVVARHEDTVRLLAQSGADLSLTGSGAPGFADKTARDLVVANGMLALAAELDPT